MRIGNPLPVICSLVIAGLFSHMVSARKVQSPGLELPENSEIHRASVVQIFKDSYGPYVEIAFPHDDLAPVTKGFVDGRNGWGATAVDAMTTMLVMGLEDQQISEWFEQALQHSFNIDFSDTTDRVSVFETTIRYLGGFLGTYELAKALHDRDEHRLIDKATEVADMMSVAWNETVQNVVPFGFVDATAGTSIPGTSNIAEAGSLTLEWSTLSKYTGDDTYGDLAVGSAKHIAQLEAPLPGLAAQSIDPASGSFLNSYITWGGGSDSYFEYLIKYARLTNTDDETFVETWKAAIESTIENLLVRSTVGNWLYVAERNDAEQIRHISSHLACFHAGNWILGGRHIGDEQIVNLGLELADACYNTYATTTGIGPEMFAYIGPDPDGDSTEGNISDEDSAFYKDNGWYVYNGQSSYYLRPEVMESNFIAWRATGDQKYYDRAVNTYQAFQTHLRAPVGYAGINDVRQTNSGKIDHCESFWFAEVLKYLFLTFDDPDRISLDEWVFNTEAHPLRADSA